MWHCWSMYQQHRIPSTLAQPAALTQVRQLLAAAGSASRTEIGRRVCACFGFLNAHGQPQLASCLQALRALHKRRQIELPPSRHRGRRVRPRRLGQPVPPPVAVPARVDQVQDLQLRAVQDAEQSCTWNELMAGEHPCGAVQQAGAQLRYLLVSEHGVLGACGFAAAALTLAPRDHFIGWDAATRGRHLHRVLGLSRFLIRPGVQCRNLASKALALAVRQVPDDCLRRYGYRPWLLETFVAPPQRGISLAAANWRCIGHTAGRGRCAPSGQQVPPKAIWLYELERNWRRELGLPAPGLAALQAGAGLASDAWVQQEFGAAPLGDVRLSRRLVQSVQIQAGAPSKSFPSAAQHNLAAVRGYYRLIDQPADSEVTPENILAPHRQRTLQRMQGQQTLLCLQDGTDLNFAEHPGCVGLGLIGRNQGSQGTLGIHMHSTMVVNGEGLPLGVPHIQYETPDGQAEQGRPLEQRKTMRWIRSLRACAEWAQQLPGVRPLSVMDREGDVYAIFAEQQRLGSVDVLVRARHDRVLCSGQPKLFAAVRAQAAQGHLQIHVARQSARRASRGQAERDVRAERVAQVELRWQALELRDPQQPAATLPLHVVHVCEPQAPAGAEPLEWFLLTSLAVHSRQDAQCILSWYCLRWRIEDWHRVLKSGCKVEYLGHRQGERIERAVTISAVIAWRLAAMTLLGRDTPELPPETFFSEIEIAALEDFAQERQLSPPDNLGRAVQTLAMLGGYLNFKRKRYAQPGHQVLWEGYTRLATIVQCVQRTRRLHHSSKLYQKMRAP